MSDFTALPHNSLDPPMEKACHNILCQDAILFRNGCVHIIIAKLRLDA